MLKRIALSISLMAFAGVLVYGATGAFFSDSETSTGNTFSAGDIDLQIDNESYVTSTTTGLLIASPSNSWAMANLTNQLFFSFTDVKPGDVGEDTISVHAGSNDAYACMAADITATPENTLVDPETDAGDVGPASGNNGELQNFINFTFWNDDGDNVYETGESQITALTGPASSIFNGAWSPVGTTSVIAAGSTKYVAKAWCFGALALAPVAQDGLGKTGANGPLVRGTGVSCNGAGSNNIAQTDGIVVDVSFQAVQARNNGQFTCASLPIFNGSSTQATLWTENGVEVGGDATVIGTSTESGNNALQLTTTDDVNSRVRYSYDVADIDASAFTGFSFDSKQVKAFDMVNGNASFRLIVDLDGNLATLGDVKDVTYEPYYNILAHNVLNDASITPNLWQNWAATLANGKFWAGGVTTILGPSEGAGGAYATNFTIQQLVDSYPNAKITGISIGMGTYNKDQVILVDNLILNGNVLGFE